MTRAFAREPMLYPGQRQSSGKRRGNSRMARWTGEAGSRGEITHWVHFRNEALLQTSTLAESSYSFFGIHPYSGRPSLVCSSLVLVLSGLGYGVGVGS
jgi:hypothetical protein